MTIITDIKARQIIDSRGNPTVEADVLLDNGAFGRASVPSGASTGSNEALELRDLDSTKYNGKGVISAVSNINHIIAQNIIGLNAKQQTMIDSVMIELDGTHNKSNLGANAILAVSLAVAKAAAAASEMSLYRYLGGIYNNHMPRPMMNIINGGAHADNGLDFQEFMIIPMTARNMSEYIRVGCEIFHKLKSIIKSQGYNTNVGDEGGFAPNINSPQQAIEMIMEASLKAGYDPERDIAIALDIAASEFYENGKYHLNNNSTVIDSDQLIKIYSDLVNQYNIISIEDPMAENDIDGWKNITKALGHKISLVGDDLFVTNPKILKEFIDKNIANAVLIKPNQIGTLTETLKTVEIANKAGYKTILSHRSGETEDTTIAHIAVAVASMIKTGSLSRTDRICKYNELLRIEEEICNTKSFV